MKNLRILSVAYVAVAAVMPLATVHADSAEAVCEVRKDGDTKRGASGPCTFSQRQGYVDLDLRNGDTYSLAPGAKAGQAEGELERRGYSYATGSTSGSSKYSSWYNRSTGRCVMIRTEEGRYQSIVQTNPVDCGR